MDITPLIPKGKQVISGYAPGYFLINDKRHEGSLIVLPDETRPWSGEISLASLEPLSGIELLLIGTGCHIKPLSPDIRHALRAKGIAVDIMDSGAACRTYNVLLGEGRLVGAALIQLMLS